MFPTAQVGNFGLSAGLAVWEASNMADTEELEGVRLYDAFMAIKPQGLAETDWAEGAGLNRGFFGNLKTKAKNPRRDSIRKLLAHIGKSEADLDANPPAAKKAGARLPVPVDNHPPTPGGPDDVVEITALDLSISMGPGTLIEEFIEAEPIKMGLGLIQSITRTPSDRLRLVRGVGDSMEPTLRSGDRVMVDINEHALARINGIYWIDHLGTHGIKRLRASGRGKVMVMSDNPLVPAFEVDAQDLRIEGRVIWFAREL